MGERAHQREALRQRRHSLRVAMALPWGGGRTAVAWRREAGGAAAFGVLQRKEGEAKENREEKGEDRGHTPAAPLLTVAGEPPVRARPPRRRRFGELREKGGG